MRVRTAPQTDIPDEELVHETPLCPPHQFLSAWATPVSSWSVASVGHDMEWVPVYVSDLEALKALLVIGFIASAVLLRMVWSIDRPIAAKASAPTCKLHQRPEDQCRDMHNPDA